MVIAWISFLSRDIIAKAPSDNSFVNESKVGGQRGEIETGKNHQELNFQEDGGKIGVFFSVSACLQATP